jgi:uncharacterized lipoprotein YmbA
LNVIAAAAQPTRRRPLRAAGLVLLGAASLVLGACGSSGPPPALYVLGAAPAAATTTAPQVGLPVVEVKPVGVPDYLDTTDLLIRHDSGQVVPSQVGRWGERLSAGVTRALAAALAARLPRMAVTATPPVERPARQVLVDVETFEARADGEVVLVARWSVTDGAARETLAAERVSLAGLVAGTGDPAVVAAMTRESEGLASQVAAGLERTYSARQGPR